MKSPHLLLLRCGNCGTTVAFNPFMFALPPGGFMTLERCSALCPSCRKGVPLPSMTIDDDGVQYFSRVAEAAIVLLKQEDDPRSAAKHWADLLSRLSTADQIEAASESGELHWIKQYLPASRDEWFGFIRQLIILLLVLAANPGITEIKRDTGAIFCEATGVCCEMMMMHKAAEVIVEVSWQTSDPKRYLEDCRNILRSLRTDKAIQKAKDTTLPWLEYVLPQSKAEWRYWIDTLIFGTIAAVIGGIITGKFLAGRKNKPSADDVIKYIIDERNRRR